MRWVILTGEYPPQPGGVSDYAALVAKGLAEAGEKVAVFAPPGARAGSSDGGLQVHVLPDHFGLRSMRRLGRLFRRERSRILVQYVPQAFGWKAMNLPFCFWLSRQRRHDLWVMFHEVLYPSLPGQSWRHRLLATVTRQMARLVVQAAKRVLVSIPAWENLIRSVCPRCPPVTWLPIPSSIPGAFSPRVVAEIRGRIARQTGGIVLGHFGTFGRLVSPLLADLAPPLLGRDRQRVALFVGRGGPEFVCSLEKAHPDLRGRLFAPGDLPPEEVANHLAACDLLVQPYPDGASSRRSSLMAGLCLGLPIVTAEGPLSEPIWRESGAVALAPGGRIEKWVECVESLLADERKRAELGKKARLVYETTFDIRRVIDVLRAGNERKAGEVDQDWGEGSDLRP